MTGSLRNGDAKTSGTVSGGASNNVLFRAKLLALFGALICVLFFVLYTVKFEERETPEDRRVDIVAVIASAEETFDPADVPVFSEAEENSVPDKNRGTGDVAELDKSVWSYLEDVLRRLLRRESD